MKDVAEIIAEKIATVRLQEPLSRHTSFKIGGPADLYLEAENVEQLVFALSCLRKHKIPYYVLGSGTNILVHDDGYRGAVIRLAGQFREFNFQQRLVTAGAAVPLAVLAQRAQELGLRGLEFAAGIPGSVGGALVMNAGAHGHALGELVLEAQILDSALTLHTYQPQDLGLSYRKSNIGPPQVVCAVKLQLAAGDRDELKRQSRDALTFRRNRQPRQPNAGSIFKNPPHDAAGRLIEAAGLKGQRVGGAAISDVHANFIVNEQNATAQDVMTLITKIQQEVWCQFGIELELEIRLLGY